LQPLAGPAAAFVPLTRERRYPADHMSASKGLDEAEGGGAFCPATHPHHFWEDDVFHDGKDHSSVRRVTIARAGLRLAQHQPGRRRCRRCRHCCRRHSCHLASHRGCHSLKLKLSAHKDNTISHSFARSLHHVCRWRLARPPASRRLLGSVCNALGPPLPTLPFPADPAASLGGHRSLVWGANHSFWPWCKVWTSRGSRLSGLPAAPGSACCRWVLPDCHLASASRGSAACHQLDGGGCL